MIGFLRYALLGVVAGGVIGSSIGVMWWQFTPTTYVGTITLFHASGSGMSDSGRDFVRATLRQKGFLPAVAEKHGWSADAVDRIRGVLTVTAEDASRPLAEMHLEGRDEKQIRLTLDTLADEISAHHRDRLRVRLQSQLSDLDAELASARKQQRALEAASGEAAPPSPAAIEALERMTRLARQRRGLELSVRYRMRPESEFEETRRVRYMKTLITQRERMNARKLDDIDTGSESFKRARALALATAETQALELTKERLDDEFKALDPLQIVRSAEIAARPSDYRIVLILSAAGGLLGLFAGGFVWSRHQAPPRRDSATRVESSLRIPVLAVIAESVSDYGERESRALAAADPQHLGIAGIHSLRIALLVLARGERRNGPVICAEAGTPRHAIHVVANLAVVAAREGERVLVIEATAKPGPLSAIFDDEPTALVAQDPGRDLPEPGLDATAVSGERRIRVSTAGDAAMNLGREFAGSFDRIFVYCDDLAQALALADTHENAVSLLVCSVDTPPEALRQAHGKKFDGAVLCAYPVDEADYRDGSAIRQ